MALEMQSSTDDLEFVKRSFTKLPIEIDVDALLRDYNSIPEDAWLSSHWATHCSVNMLLLRGGNKGTQEDFTTDDVHDNSCLEKLPYMASLVKNGGIFGVTTYAFILRMKPMGISRKHVDDDSAWKSPFRVHVPITTNDGAILMSEKFGKHFPVGEVWTFNNNTEHSVVNGDSVRAHLIIDVQPNPKLRALLDNSTFDPGVLDEEAWVRADVPLASPVLSFADSEPLSLTEKTELGLEPDGFASRITARRAMARLHRIPVCVGDVIYSVDNVEKCEVTRTALDYINLRHQPGETISVGLLRSNKRREESVRLYENVLPESVRRAWWRLSDTFR